MAHDLAQVMPKLAASTRRARILTAVTASRQHFCGDGGACCRHRIAVSRGEASLLRPQQSLNDLKWHSIDTIDHWADSFPIPRANRPVCGRVRGRSLMVEDMRSEICGAYSRRAAEYAAHLGSMKAVHPADRQLVDTRADQIDGPAIDAVGGVLAWYSLIHCEPGKIQAFHQEFARALRPGSDLLLGFFEGPMVKKFEHTVVAAHRWPVAGGMIHADHEVQYTSRPITNKIRKSGLMPSFGTFGK